MLADETDPNKLRPEATGIKQPSVAEMVLSNELRTATREWFLRYVPLLFPRVL